MAKSSEEEWIRRLLDVGRALTTELDQRIVLDRVLETAREVTGAQYAALGVLNEQHDGLERFLTAGIDEETRRAIGDLPRGRGVLGVLIEDPRPLRLTDVGTHASSYGFPVGHPVMGSFLGVPVVIRGRVWGNLYLTEKRDGDAFSQEDEEAAVILAQWAAIAIENARLYEASEREREKFETAFRNLQATRDVAVAIEGELAPERLLELIAKRGRALVGARSLVIMLREGEELVVQTVAGHVEKAPGGRLPIAGSTYGEVLERRSPERIADVGSRLRIASDVGVEDPKTALLVPMVHRGDALGILAAFDRGVEHDVFSDDDEQMLRAFASNAATAVALARSVQADRLRSSLAAADAERRRWARELHDETLQGLGALRVLLSSALRRGDPERAQTAMREAVDHVEREIENLRAIITELRPAALDELGLRTAIEALLDRHREQSGLQIEAELALPGPQPGGGHLGEELETTVYRLVQEAMTNVAKHARASTVRVAVTNRDGELQVEVGDDGCGFDTRSQPEGFGLAGMLERVTLAGGSLEIVSGDSGTLVKARVPMPQAGAGESATVAA